MQNVTKEGRNGLKFTCATPTTVDEFDKLAKKVGTCLADAVSNVWYRGVFPKAWDALAKILATKYSIARKMKPRADGGKDAAGKPIMVDAESDQQYVDRVAAEKDVAVTTFQSIIDAEINPKLVFDPSATERKPGAEPGPGKANLALATTYLADPKVCAKVVKNIEKALGHKVALTGTPEEQTKALAYAIKEYVAAQSALLAA